MLFRSPAETGGTKLLVKPHFQIDFMNTFDIIVTPQI